MAKMLVLQKFIMIVIVLCSCKGQHPVNSTLPQQKTRVIYIRELVNRIDRITLPYKHNLVSDSEKTCSYTYNEHGYDTLFLKPEQAQIIGLLPDTSKFFGILYFYPGDDMVPCLVTFSKTGIQIDDQSLTNSTCAGGGCDIDSCNAETFIDKSLEISMWQRTVITECDDKGEKKKNAASLIYIQQKGHINEEGKIMLNKPEKKTISLPGK